MEPYYEKLRLLNEGVAQDFSDEFLTVTAPTYVDSNFPWLYVKFEYDGQMSLHDLKEIEKRFLAFTAMEGGALESIHLSRRGYGFTVKLVYVPGKKKAPGAQGLSNSDSAVKP